VLSIGAVAGGSGGYYVAGVAEGLEDYYLPAQDREAPGEWYGKGAEALGLSGEVDAQAFLDLLANRDPNTGVRLRARPGKNGAFDLTFSAPKSVSLIYAYGTDEQRQIVRDAYKEAVKAAVSFAEAECGAVRIGAGGTGRMEGLGWTTAIFEHRTSREGDPQLHFHVVVANAVQGIDGKWRTLDGAAIFSSATTIGAVFQAHGRALVVEQLGSRFDDPVKNLAEIATADRAVLAEFSRRSKQLEGAVGRDASRRAREAAALDTRKAKADAPRVDIPALADHDARDYGVPPGRVEQWWQKRIDELGLDPHEIVDPMIGVPRTPERLDARALAEPIAAALTAEHAKFTRRDLIRAVTNSARDGARVEDVLAVVDEVMAHPEYVRLDPDKIAPSVMERRDGTRVQVQRPDPLTTRTQLAKERLIETSTRQRLNDNAGIARSHHVEDAVRSRTSLGADQAHLVRELTTSGRGVEIVIGAPGSGKTFTLGAAAEAWQASGFRVLGTAHAAVAAEQLSEALVAKAGDPTQADGTQARTIDSLLLAVETGREQLDRRTVLIVDEAEMAGTDRLARLTAACDEKGAKLVLVGDPAQLPSIDAGGMLRVLQDRFASTIKLETNRRQHAEWERQAITDLRNGRTQPFLDAYQREGRIHFHDTAEQRARAVAINAVVDYEAGRTALVLTGTNDNVDALNAAVQQRRHEAGHLGEHIAHTARGEALHEGDRMMLLRNEKQQDLRNGQVVTVVARRDGALVVERHDGRRIGLDADYVNQHTRLGYASTTHKAQGATADVCHFAPDGMSAKELSYVATTRGRASNQFHLTAEPTDDARSAALDRLEWDLRRSIAKSAAIDTGDTATRAEPRRPQPTDQVRAPERREVPEPVAAGAHRVAEPPALGDFDARMPAPPDHEPMQVDIPSDSPSAEWGPDRTTQALGALRERPAEPTAPPPPPPVPPTSAGPERAAQQAPPPPPVSPQDQVRPAPSPAAAPPVTATRLPTPEAIAQITWLDQPMTADRMRQLMRDEPERRIVKPDGTHHWDFTSPTARPEPQRAPRDAPTAQPAAPTTAQPTTTPRRPTAETVYGSPEPPPPPPPPVPEPSPVQRVRAWMSENPDYELYDAHDVVVFAAKRENAQHLPPGMTPRDVASVARELHALIDAEDQARAAPGPQHGRARSQAQRGPSTPPLPPPPPPPPPPPGPTLDR